MNATEAKVLAEKNRALKEEELKLRQEKQREAELDVLGQCFRDKISEAVALGRFSATITFPNDRFGEGIVREAAQKIKKDGYNLQMEKNVAYQTTKFTLSW